MNNVIRHSDHLHIRGSMPWAGAPSSHGCSSPEDHGLRYRGWLLIDVFDWRYAVNDRTGERVRVCQERTNTADAIHAFHAKVDEFEATR